MNVSLARSLVDQPIGPAAAEVLELDRAGQAEVSEMHRQEPEDHDSAGIVREPGVTETSWAPAGVVTIIVSFPAWPSTTTCSMVSAVIEVGPIRQIGRVRVDRTEVEALLSRGRIGDEGVGASPAVVTVRLSPASADWIVISWAKPPTAICAGPSGFVSIVSAGFRPSRATVSLLPTPRSSNAV